jgi:hypothetical protein
MKTTQRLLTSLGICALYAGCNSTEPNPPQTGATQPDLSTGLNNSVYLQNAHASLSEGNTLGQQSTTVVGTSAYNTMIGDFQSYQNSMNMIVNAEADTTRPKVEFVQLMDVATQAAKAKDADEQVHLFGNYLFDSRNFLIKYPDFPGNTQVWVMRAVAALRLNKPVVGYEAGRMLLALPADRTDSHIEKVLDVLEKQGWLARDKIPGAKPRPAVTPVADTPGR